MMRRRRKMNGSITISSSTLASPTTETTQFSPQPITEVMTESIPTYIQPTTTTVIANNISTPSTHQDILIPVDLLSTTPIVVENTPIMPTKPQSVITPQQPSDNMIRP